MNDKGKGIFYGVVAVATLIVAIVGATLAYFSIMVNSENNAVGLSSDIVSISYSDGQYLINPATKLIPATNEVVKKAYERVTVFDKDNDEDTTNKCIDDNGKEVCSVYRFTVSNDGEDRDITASIKVGLNEFTNLRYMVYEVTTVDGNTVKTNVFDEITGEDKSYALPLTTDESSSLFGYTQSGEETVYKTKTLATSSPRTFEVVIYLNETNSSQNDEQGKNFYGTLYVSFNTSGSDKITGHID